MKCEMKNVAMVGVGAGVRGSDYRRLPSPGPYTPHVSQGNMA